MPAPQYWTPLPGGFPWATKPSVLLAEFGAVGPYSLIVLLAAATTQKYLGGPRGWARLGWLEMARTTAVDVPAAQTIVRRIAELGEVELHETRLDFRARLVAWEEWDQAPKDRTAAERKRRQRERERKPIFDALGHECVHCGATEDLTLDHIKPRNDGGTDELSNLQILCGACNSSKRDRDAPGAHMKSRKKS